MFKKLKLLLLRFINRLGYTVYKLPRKPGPTKKMGSIVLGGKALKVPVGNPLYFHYQQYPNFNQFIGTMAASIQKRHPMGWAVDVGANIGDTLAIIKSLASWPVICVEGDEFCHKILQENARQFEQVHVVHTFLGDKMESANIESQKVGWNRTLLPAKSGSSSETLKFLTLDYVVGEIKQPVIVKLLKVDTEGYDLRIIRGARELLERDQPVITFELNRENVEPLGDSVGDFFDFLVGLGYAHFLVNDAYDRLICPLGKESKALLLDLYQYSNLGQPLYYFDIWAFHQNDRELFDQVLESERVKRI